MSKILRLFFTSPQRWHRILTCKNTVISGIGTRTDGVSVEHADHHRHLANLNGVIDAHPFQGTPGRGLRSRQAGNPFPFATLRLCPALTEKNGLSELIPTIKARSFYT